MKNILTFIATCLCYIAFFSCSKHQPDIYITQPTDTLRIEPSTASTKKIQYSKFIEHIDYILTPSDEDFMIGNIDKLLVTDDYIFLLDEKITRAIYCINKTGKKVFTIKKTGTGPGEYDLIRDFSFDVIRKEIIVYCYIRQKLIYYNLNGDFLREKRTPFNASRIQPINDKFAFFTEFEKNYRLEKENQFPNLFLASEKFSILSRADYFEHPINQSIVWSTDCQFSQWSDTLSIKPDHRNIVYHITKDKIYPAYKLNFGEYSIDERYWKKSREEGLTLKGMDDYCNNINLCESFRFLEGKNYLYFIYKQNKTLYYVLMSKKTNRMIHAKKFDNDIDFITPFDPIAIHGNKLYCLINSEDLFLAKSYLKGIIPNKILNSVQEFGNPVIAVITLKDF